MVHLLDKKIRGSNIMIKLDMMKAFDRVNWTFLQQLLRCLGFSERFITIILNHLKGTYISVLINGSPSGFFSLNVDLS